MDDTYQLIHLQYTGWPDHSVPTSIDNLATFVKQIEQTCTEVDPSSVVVHCRYFRTFIKFLLFKCWNGSIWNISFNITSSRTRFSRT